MICTKNSRNSITVRDTENNVLEIEAPNWSPTNSLLDICYETDKIIGMSVNSLKLPESAVGIESSTYKSWITDISSTNTCSLPDGKHLIKIENFISTYIRTNSSLELIRNEKGNIIVKFPKKTDATIGLKERFRRPKTSIHVYPSSSGVANAINRISLDEKLGPERSFPSVRDHPPLFNISRQKTPETDVVFRQDQSSTILELPKSIEYVFLSAPFAYYSNSIITLTNTKHPMIIDQLDNVLYEFDKLPKFNDQIILLLKKIFDLDCIIREQGKYKSDVIERRALDKLSFDLTSLYDATPLERFKKYLLIDYNDACEIFPDWHCSTFIDPIIENISTLPHILNNLIHVIQPRAKSVSKKDIINRTLQNSRGSKNSRNFELIFPIVPNSAKSELVNWCHEGVPVNAVKSTPKSMKKWIENDSIKEPKIAVILNDFSMNMELEEVLEIYNSKANLLSLQIDLFNNISSEKLKNIFQKNYELVHFIGHCESNGLTCSNGQLKPEEIDFVDSKIFFLNACNSYEVGLSLVKKGCIGGVVTINKILDSNALKVGILFSRLVISGYPIKNALEISQKSFLVKNYIPIGEGAYNIFQGKNNSPSEYYLESVGSDKFEIKIKTPQINSKGGICQVYFSNITKQCLSGNSIQFRVSKPKLKEGLKNLDAPIFFQGNWYWSDKIMDMV